MNRFRRFVNRFIFRAPPLNADFDHAAYNRAQTLTGFRCYEDTTTKLGMSAVKIAGYGYVADRYISRFHESRSKTWREAAETLDAEQH